MKARRVDVLSTTGGVGKTVLAWCLADAQARRSERPVLLVDADITGPCIGNLIEGSIDWERHPDLIRLITGRPELLPELLDKDSLPVYLQRRDPPPRLEPERVSASTTGAALLFCPSAGLGSGSAGGKPQVIHALLGNESAGGWAGYVIEQVIDATQRVLGGTADESKLGGIVVDHGPTMGPLQWTTLAACDAEPNRQLLFVTDPDVTGVVQLARTVQKQFTNLGSRFRWVVNRLDRDQDWRQSVRKRVADMPDPEGWLAAALPHFTDRELASAYAEGALRVGADSDPRDIEAIRAALFED